MRKKIKEGLKRLEKDSQNSGANTRENEGGGGRTDRTWGAGLIEYKRGLRVEPAQSGSLATEFGQAVRSRWSPD